MPELKDLYGIGLIPVIVAFVQWLKAVWPECPARLHPVWALLLGIGLNLLLGWQIGTPLWTAGIIGLLVGLAAGGFYGAVKATVLGR